MRALSIRQPYAELILRGIKTIEYRSRSTSIVGERFWIYASKKPVAGKLFLEGCSGDILKGEFRRMKESPAVTADNLEVPATGEADWMIDLANTLRLFPYDLPTGVIVGSAVIAKVVSCELVVGSEDQGAGISSLPTTNHQLPTSSLYQWHLTDVQRAKRLRKPKGHPQPVWFRPF